MMDVMAGLPAFGNVNLARMLHGEQYIEIMKPLPTSGNNNYYRVISSLNYRDVDSQRCNM